MTAGVSGRESESGIKNVRLRYQLLTGNWQKVQAVGTCVCIVCAEAPPSGPTMAFWLWTLAYPNYPTLATVLVLQVLVLVT
jgi:hypothetical protein